MKLGDKLDTEQAEALKKRLDKAAEKERVAKLEREKQSKLKAGKTIRYNKD